MKIFPRPRLLFRGGMSFALLAIGLASLPMMVQAEDNPLSSVTGFLSRLGHNIVGHGKQVLAPNDEDRYEHPRARYDDQQYARSHSMEASVQQALARNGYYNGPIDGNIGPASRRAISRFQSDHGLRVTGYPDGNVVNALGL